MAGILCMTALAQTFEVTGKIFLRDSTSTAAAYVTVYCPSTGNGTLSDEQGGYSLLLPVKGSSRLEFSLMGYATVAMDVANDGSGKLELPPVYLDIQPIMLSAAYITPDGQLPADYILGQVWKKARINRKKMQDYDASVNYRLATHQMDLVPKLFSKMSVGAAKTAVFFTGYYPLFNYCLTHEDMSVKASLERKVRNGKATDSNHRLISSDSVLPNKVRKNVLNIFELVDLFDLVYGTNNEWGEKFSKKHKFKLVGTYEYGSRLVDVLYWKNKYSGFTATVHVIEEEWGILKIEVGRGSEVLRMEARDVKEGIFMPVTLI
ncbi:MAG: carboxypeptidase-like regulatory domain-containing protein, partial [Bacteroidales bacterium]|nr:carboxypeptidase-like regulatory domain-containing protein [Bacteroidales bacterium]